MTQMDPAALAYLARRDVSAQWRGFLRALLETLDAHLDRNTRNGLLRAVGTRLGQAVPLPAAATLPELEARMNAALAELSWGYVAVALDETDRSLRLSHHAAPAVGAAGDEAGEWFATVLEGLYAAWLAQQQGGGAEGGPQLRLVRHEPGLAELRYGS
ncbi:cellulose synthase [Pseudoroseomonas rhizosphaerae]|uniref:Cellulose synthase n=1 Tax=Teichococcus rhizosphaerae TaxID=1335062 RepID=A0A2C6XYN3_9PROT|nr:cellulose biosynthesis protein BcsD [Pseudoroseomonas rhizosphaerae]PHK93652.1 cellulose synthase [Pseudoroseomonas rhizosphaerae]